MASLLYAFPIDSKEKSMRIQTQCIHSGTVADPITRGINSPIFPSSAYDYLDADHVAYPRYFNTPNQNGIVRKICALEGAQDGVVFSSGMAAISSVLLSFLKAGDHVILQDEIYGGSHAFIEQFFERFGIAYTFTATDPGAMEAAIKPETRLIYIETPTNPLLSIVDIRAVTAIARRHGCLSIIDNTFATPICQTPIKMGVDIVIHSGTKYLGGHSDLSCGATVTNSDLALQIRQTALNFGGNLNALSCYLLERSLKTLSVRVKQQIDNALQIAQFLNQWDAIKMVYYPGLSKHPGHNVASAQMNGYGAMLAFELKNEALSADAFMRKLKLIKPAVSLGGVESTICDPARTSHAKVSAEVRARQGITDNLMRFSVGIEHVDDLVEDIQQALED